MYSQFWVRCIVCHWHLSITTWAVHQYNKTLVARPAHRRNADIQSRYANSICIHIYIHIYILLVWQHDMLSYQAARLAHELNADRYPVREWHEDSNQQHLRASQSQESSCQESSVLNVEATIQKIFHMFAQDATKHSSEETGRSDVIAARKLHLQSGSLLVAGKFACNPRTRTLWPRFQVYHDHFSSSAHTRDSANAEKQTNQHCGWGTCRLRQWPDQRRCSWQAPRGGTRLLLRGSRQRAGPSSLGSSWAALSDVQRRWHSRVPLACMYVFMYVCMHVCMCMLLCIRMYATRCACVCVCVCMHVCMYLRI